MTEDTRVQQIKDKITSLIKEATDLRFGNMYLPEVGAPSDELIESLVVVRRVLDRLEEIHLQLLRFKSFASSLNATVSEEHDNEWDAVISRNKTSSVIRNEYTAAKERYAEANLATLESRRKVKQAAEFLEFCSNASEVVRTQYRGMDGVRQDILTVLKSQQFMNHLEQ